MKKLLIFSVYLFCTLFLLAKPDKKLETIFLNPPDEARPWVYWYWMNGNVTSEGIIADLQAMKEVGIGGVFLMDIGIHPAGSVSYRSKEWYDLVRLALSEAQKRNIKVSFHCPGWSASGGPWVTPEMGMQELAWSELRINGSAKTPFLLPKPSTRLNYYRDIAVLAFPTPGEDNWSFRDLSPIIKDTNGIKIVHAEQAIDGDMNTSATLPATFDIEFSNDKPVGSVFIRIARNDGTDVATIYTWDSITKSFSKALETGLRRSGPFSAHICGGTFPMVRTQKIRVVINNTLAGAQTTVDEISFCGGYRLPEWTAKAGFNSENITRNANERSKSRPFSKESFISKEKIIDLSDRLDANGKLNWNIPPGEWTILRMGYTPTGIKIFPAPVNGDGLECDKLSIEAADFHYDHFISALMKELGKELSGKIANHHVDSYEAGWQNWTPKFAEEFKKYRGYDLLKYLPALTGRIVDSIPTSEKFLWDFRRTISDLFANNHYARLATRSHADGLGFSNEPYLGPFNCLQIGEAADFPMCEFWTPNTTPKQRKLKHNHGVYVGHTYGKKIIGCEAFTSESPSERWNNHPYSLKGAGDFAFCSGINRLVVHVYAHQPFMDEHLRPGMTCGGNGIHFDRNNTWWYHGAKQWVEYLTRCQAMLQQGEHIADALYFQGNESPANDIWPEPLIPKGYDFDACCDEVLQRLQVRNGRIVLPFGKEYRYLVLPSHGLITDSLLSKIAALVKAGATIIGMPVEKSPSLSDQMTNIGGRSKLAGDLWGKNPDNKGKRNLGNGRVIWGLPFTEILSKDALPPDFSYDDKEGILLNYNHRQTSGSDIYFVASGSDQAGWVNCRFRVTERIPQLWKPDAGVIEPLLVFRRKGDVIEIPVYFDPMGSVFVVFKNPGQKENPVVSVTCNGWDVFKGDENNIGFHTENNGGLMASGRKEGNYTITYQDGKTHSIAISKLPPPIVLSKPWSLNFPKGWGAPGKIEMNRLCSWSEYPDNGVKYFSGTATYRTIFNIPKGFKGLNRSIFLDLGQVEVIAEVTVNGKELGTMWKPPFRVDVTSIVKEGINEVEVLVTNLWPNRMIGDEQYPADISYNGWGGVDPIPAWLLNKQLRPQPGRMTFTALKAWKKDEPLLPSGLIGPISIYVSEEIPL
jgi:hypothetical protein